MSFDGPGQGETEAELPICAEWEGVVAAVLESLEAVGTLDLDRVGVTGVSLGGYYAARAATGDRRLRAVASIGGCYSLGDSWSQLPLLSRQAFVSHAHCRDEESGAALAALMTMRGAPEPVRCPFLVVHGGQDRLFSEDQARRLAACAGDRGTLVIEPRGDHVCHNLAYRVRPLVADWMAERLSEV